LDFLFVPLLAVLSSLALAFTLGWDNSGLTTGNLSNFMSYGLALSVTLLGVLVGFLAEGSKMTESIVGKLIVSQISVEQLLVGVASSLILFLALSIFKIPVSLSNCVVGAFVGVAFADQSLINFETLIKIAASWVVAPFICALVAMIIYYLLVRSEQSTSIVTLSWANRLVLIASVFYVSYALGANNLGLIFSFERFFQGSFSSIQIIGLEILTFIALLGGTVLLGKSIAKVVGDKLIALSQIKTVSAILASALVVWSFTQFSVPVSLTQVVIGGMLGAGIAHGPTVVNKMEVAVMTRDWVIVTLGCTVLGFAIESLIHFI
jgi:phosphate/sulfate permease